MIFGVLNPEKIWHQKIVHLPTSPVYCSHFTLGNLPRMVPKCDFGGPAHGLCTDMFVVWWWVDQPSGSMHHRAAGQGRKKCRPWSLITDSSSPSVEKDHIRCDLSQRSRSATKKWT